LPSGAGLDALATVRHQIERALDGQLDAKPFLGAWCVEGDSNMRAAIAETDGTLKFDNGIGSKSSGDLSGQGGVVATEWQALGMLTPDRSQLDWTNGTYWMRCAAPVNKLPGMSGRWIAVGDTARPCSIRERGRSLSLDNGLGVKGSGRMDANGGIVSSWSARRVAGQLTPDGNHINWDNGTYWTRASVYETKTPATHHGRAGVGFRTCETRTNASQPPP
jgi:hypothetical protein